jgi:hypothetical protein
MKIETTPYPSLSGLRCSLRDAVQEGRKLGYYPAVFPSLMIAASPGDEPG